MLNDAMQTPHAPAESATGRDLHPVEVPVDDSAVPRVVSAVADALADGPAMLPLSPHPRVRDSVLAECRPSEPVADDIALVVPTSGSTGTPKGVLLSRQAVHASAAATEERLGGPGHWLLAVPATSVAGVMVIARSVLSGTEPVAMDLTGRFRPDGFAAASMRLFSSGGRHFTSLVPRQLGILVEAGGAALDALTRYDAVLVGGGEIRADVLDRARSAGVSVVATYGMTETCGGCVYDGTPLSGVHVDVDDGVVRLSGPCLASGYRLRPDLGGAFADGWFTTADLGRFDDTGRLVITGRADDVAVSGGVNVPLAAVDRAVTSHPLVHDALSVPAPDEQWGQRIFAAVVAADPARPPTLESVRAHVNELAPIAYAPKEVVVVDALPVLPSGKPDRRALVVSLGLDPAARDR